MRRAPAAGRRHAVFLILIGAGVVLRVLVTLAYRPSFINPDSGSYLEYAHTLVPDPLRPLGYGVFLRAAIGLGNLAAVADLQHLMGLVMAVLIYVVLVRLGVPRWGAALGCAPVLLDGYELDMEHYVLSETLFALLVVAGCVLVLWRRRPSVAAAAGAGVLLALAGLTRAVGLALLAPVLVATIALARRRPWPTLALVAAFLVPTAGYAVWYHAEHGRYGVTGDGSLFLYARVAPFADCRDFAVPPQEHVLCPRGRPGHRMVVSRFRWSKSRSPLFRVPADRRGALAGQFARRVILHQPVAYAEAVAGDAIHAFGTTAAPHSNDGPGRWMFKGRFPVERGSVAALRRYGYGHGEVRPRIARFLRAYQRIVFVPGPLLAAGLVVALLAVLGVARARGSGLRTATFLFGGVALAIFVGAVAANEYTWRYRLPLVVLLPPAVALAITALVRRRGAL